jgi:hypothetical protein
VCVVGVVRMSDVRMIQHRLIEAIKACVSIDEWRYMKVIQHRLIE